MKPMLPPRPPRQPDYALITYMEPDWHLLPDWLRRLIRKDTK